MNRAAVDALDLRARLWRFGGSTLGTDMARPVTCARVAEVLARVRAQIRLGGSGSKWQAQSESVHEGWDHGPHVTASDCRHDGLHRGSERFFHPSPTKKHAD